jgi:putative endonuclease
MDCFVAVLLAMTARLVSMQKSLNNSVMKQPAIYIMASKRNGTLYTGVTSNLAQRAWQHREGMLPGFTKRYRCKLLVYYEYYETMEQAIGREKQIKAGSCLDKIRLIEFMNPMWSDLYASLA